LRNQKFESLSLQQTVGVSLKFGWQSGKPRGFQGVSAEADEPGKIGRAHALLLGQGGKRHAVVADECGVEPTRVNRAPVIRSAITLSER
jgi:hypothetical protein